MSRRVRPLYHGKEDGTSGGRRFGYKHIPTYTVVLDGVWHFCAFFGIWWTGMALLSPSSMDGDPGLSTSVSLLLQLFRDHSDGICHSLNDIDISALLISELAQVRYAQYIAHVKYMKL